MSTRPGSMACLLAAAMFAAPVPAKAGPLAPGETRGGAAYVLNLDDPSFAGDTLLSETTPFEIVFEHEEIGTSFVRGTFTHLVVRESTGRLAFHYRVQETASGGSIIDFENMFVSGFAGFTTDVFSDQTDLTEARASRSADGDTIDFIADEEPFSGNFVVRTNATAFEAGAGSASVLARFQGSEPIGGSDRTVVLAATAAPVPLPPAVWAGLATMGAFGAFKRLRRRRA